MACDLCDNAILSSEPEFELQLEPHSPQVVRFHRRCHSIWESARHEAMQWTPVAQIAPPAIAAHANEVQWIDYGPPTTASSPTNTPARFYRVFQTH